MAIYEFTSEKIRPIQETNFSSAGVKERGDIQRLLKRQIDVVSSDTLIIAEEFGEWDESRRRIDLLGLDKSANLVVIEIKRTEDGGHMELQAVRYAAMVSTMTFEKAAEVFDTFLKQNQQTGDARTLMLDFLDWEEPDPDRFGQDVKIVLVSAEFSKELTTAVMWLNERDIEIACVRMKPYSDGSRLFLDVQQVLPLPEAEDYTIQIRAKAAQEREARREQSTFGQICRRFWTGLLAEAQKRTSLHAHISPLAQQWVGASAGASGLRFNYVAGFSMAYVELYIDVGDQTRNKAIFKQFHDKRPEIDAKIKQPLSWEELPLKRASRVRIILNGNLRNETAWPALRANLIDAMLQLETALRPYIQALKS